MDRPAVGIVGVGNRGGGMAARPLSLGWSVRSCGAPVDPLERDAP